MSANIGANLESVDSLATTASSSGDAAIEFHQEADKHAASFQDEVEAMAAQVQGHMRDFQERLQQTADDLMGQMEGTQWEGMAREAKQERLADAQGQVQTFNGSLDSGVEDFKAALNTSIDAFYTSIANDAGTTIQALNDLLQAESTHATRYREGLEELDAAAAGGGA